MEFSGRTTALDHKHGDWQNSKGPFNPAIQQRTILEVQWTDCPVEVEEDVRKLWRDYEYGNDSYYHSWEGGEVCEGNECLANCSHKDGVGCYCGPCNRCAYPILWQYLNDRGITECLIHWWW